MNDQDAVDEWRQEFAALRGYVLFFLRRVWEIRNEQAAEIGELREMVQQALLTDHQRRPGTGPLWEKANQRWARRLVELIEKSFNEPELKALCFDFEFDFEDVRNGTHRVTVANLVMRFYRRGTLAELAMYAQQMRPAVVWPLMALDVGEE
jgi:hypothetical protein